MPDSTLTQETTPVQGTVQRVVILTGLSGAGRTTALHALEDLGFYTVDNVPPVLWTQLVEQAAGANYGKVALGVDVRTRAFLATFETSLKALRDQGLSPEIVFLDAADDVLVKRYNLTRRTHPLGLAPLSNDIASERETLEPLRARADTVLDTSRTSAKALTETLWRRFGGEQRFRLRILSFGFKRGVPLDVDNIFDLRSLPNPYYDLELRPLGGQDKRVQAYIFTPSTLEFYSEMREFIRNLTTMAGAAGRSSYTVAVGCTGGQHRSVALAERLALDFADTFAPLVEHRDLHLALEEHG